MNILTHNKLHQVAPAIFAEAPSLMVSDRYGFVPTINIVDELQDQGWYPVRAQQTHVRNDTRKMLARHMIRFRQDPDRQIKVGDSIAELVLVNSHDRSAAYQLDLGLFRLACSNGMVTPSGRLGAIKVKHGKNIVENIIEGSLQLTHEIPNVTELVEDFRSTLISTTDAIDFARLALEIRYGENWEVESPVTPEDILQVRRTEDIPSSLWNIFNRVQENMLKGGLSGRSQSGRRMRTRQIQSVTEDVRLNRALWHLTEGFAQRENNAIPDFYIPKSA